MVRDLRCFTVLFAMPYAVELSTVMGVGPCGCPISSRARRSAQASPQFSNAAPSSASAADPSTCFMIRHTVLTGPLFGGSGSVGFGFGFGFSLM